jgi:hypothetical protein
MTFVSYALADELIGRASLNRELKKSVLAELIPSSRPSLPVH